MEISQFVTPTVILTLVGVCVGLIVKAVRLQNKVDGQAQNHTELKNELKDTRERFFKHCGDATVHHNAAAQVEFRKALDRRLDGLDEGVKDISRKLNHMAGRE